MYGLTDEENYLADFYFDINQVQAVFVSDENYLSVVLGGQIYEIEYSQSIFEDIKNTLKMKTLGFN